MNKEVLKKLFIGNKAAARKEIKAGYQKKSYAMINFLYFGNAMYQRVFEKSNTEQQEKYKQALLGSDVLLADGIALQTLYAYIYHQKIHNLNGTDLTPFIIRNALKDFPKVHIALRSVYDEKIKKGKERLKKANKKFVEEYGQEIQFSRQCPYNQRKSGIDKKSYQESLETANAECNILINCTGSPFQEIWSEKEKERFKEKKILVINAGGFVDFLSGFETRAPKRVRKIRIGETFRRIAQNPKKNIKKFIRMFGIRRLLLSPSPKKQ